MCDLDDVLHGHGAGDDEYVLDTPFVREIVAGVRGCIAGADGPADACRAASPLFERLMQEREWLPEAFLEPSPSSGMGGGIGQWLIFRSGARDLCLFSLVVPAG